jgi:excisionase family DNA binding protein
LASAASERRSGTEDSIVKFDGDDQKTLSTGDLVTMLGVSRTTVHRWAVSGVLPSFKTLGGHHRFIEAEVLPIMRRRGMTQRSDRWSDDRLTG